MLYQVNGIVAGIGSLADIAIMLAGFDNLAARLALGPTGTLPLETLVARPPDLLVLGHVAGEYRTAVADNLAHPALQRLLSTRPTLRLPQSLWLCGTTHWVEAVERLAAARRRLP